MFIDNFLYIFLLIVSLILLAAMYIFRDIKDSINYRSILKIRSWFSIVIYLFFSSLIVLVSFFKIRYRITAIFVCLASVLLFMYSCIDVFYLQVKKREYILFLQRQIAAKNGIADLFTTIKLNGKYENNKYDRAQTLAVVETENDGLCIYIGGNGDDWNALKPIEKMSENQLQLYIRLLETKQDYFPVFKADEISEENLFQYELFVPNKFYYWIKKKIRIVSTAVPFIILAFIIVIAVLFLLEGRGIIALEDWIMKEIN